MAIPVAAIAAGAQAGTGIASTWSALTMNRDNRQFAQEQNEVAYKRFLENRQYETNLWKVQNDLIEKRWNQQNAYDSPAAQMARFKEAGLNPNLVYGQMSSGSPAGVGGPPSSTAPGGAEWRGQPVSFRGFAEAIQTYVALKESAARTNNLEAQNDVLRQEAALKAAQTANTVAGTELTGVTTARGKFDLDLAGELRKTSVDAAEANLRKLNAETDVMLARNEREAVTNKMSLLEAGERILNLRQQRMTNEIEMKLKAADLALKNIGVQPGDNLFFRTLARIIAPVVEEKVQDDGNKTYRINLFKYSPNRPD